MFDELSKQKIVTIVASIVVLGIFLVVGIFLRSNGPPALPSEEGNPAYPNEAPKTGVQYGDPVVRKQLNDLNTLKNYFPKSKPSTTNGINQQFRQLEALKRQSGYQPPTSAEIDAQFQELEKLRSSQK